MSKGQAEDFEIHRSVPEKTPSLVNALMLPLWHIVVRNRRESSVGQD